MSWEVACIFSTGEAMEPQLINNLPQWHYVLSKILALVWRAIAIQSSSKLSRFFSVGSWEHF